MLSTGVELVPFELLLMDIGTLVVGYTLFRASKKMAMNYTISQLLGTILIILSFPLGNTTYYSLAGGVFVAGFLAKLGIFPFLWTRRVFSNSKAIVGLVVCSQLSVVLLMSALSRDMMNQNILVIFGLFASLFSVVSALHDKKTKGAMSSVIIAQTASIFVALSFISVESLLVAITTDLLVKFTILFAEEKRDDIAQVLAAAYLAELPPFPAFSEALEILQVSLSIGGMLNVLGLLMMAALLLHRVKGGKSVGARAVGLILFVLGAVSLIGKI